MPPVHQFRLSSASPTVSVWHASPAETVRIVPSVEYRAISQPSLCCARASDRHPSAESSGFCLPHRFCQVEIHDTTRDALRGSCIFPVHSRTHTALFLRPSSGSEESRRPLPAALSYRQAAAQNFSRSRSSDAIYHRDQAQWMSPFSHSRHGIPLSLRTPPEPYHCSHIFFHLIFPADPVTLQSPHFFFPCLF